MAEGAARGSELCSLTVDGVTVARYADGGDLDERLSPRPFLHPVTTLGGVVVTAARPDDHAWHLGVSVAVQDVAKLNFWGGRTYVRDHGYLWRHDHGRVRHLRWLETAADHFAEELGWYGPEGDLTLSESRSIGASAVSDRDCWILDFRFQLRNPTGTPVTLGSPATNGRAGAGYGGFFWRLPHSARPIRVFTPDAEGEADVHGSRAPWVAVDASGEGTSTPYTLAFTSGRREAVDPWFVRVTDYPGVCSALAFAEELTLRAGEALSRGVRVYVADGALGRAGVASLLASAETTAHLTR